MPTLKRLAVVIPATHRLSGYDLAGALGTEIASTLDPIFRKVKLYYQEDENALAPEQPQHLTGKRFSTISLGRNGALASARNLAWRLAKSEPSHILAVQDCAPVQAVLSLRKAGLGFLNTHVTAIVDRTQDLSQAHQLDPDCDIRQWLHDDGLANADKVIDVSCDSLDDLRWLAGLLPWPVRPQQDCLRSSGKLAVLGSHHPVTLNALLDAAVARKFDIAVIGRQNSSVASQHKDADQFDLINDWSREATLRYLCLEKRLAAVPAGMSLQRLDCAVLGIPFANDLDDIKNERIAPRAPGDLPSVFAIAAERASEQPKRPSLLQGLRKRRTGQAVPSATSADTTENLIRDRHLLKPADVCIDETILTQLAALPADIVVAGLVEENGAPDALIADPLPPLANLDYFELHADAFVILVRTSYTIEHSFDLTGILAAARDGASCLALPIAAAIINNRQAADLRLRHQRKNGNLQRRLSPGAGMAALQRLAGVKDTSITVGSSCDGTQLLDRLTGRAEADTALRTIVADEHRRRLGTPSAPQIFGSDLTIKLDDQIEQTIELDGECCIRLAFDTTKVIDAHMHMTVSISSANGNQCLERTLQVSHTGASQDIYFQPLRGACTVALSCTSDGPDTSTRVALISVSLLTPLHLWFENRQR